MWSFKLDKTLGLYSVSLFSSNPLFLLRFEPGTPRPGSKPVPCPVAYQWGTKMLKPRLLKQFIVNFFNFYTSTFGWCVRLLADGWVVGQEPAAHEARPLLRRHIEEQEQQLGPAAAGGVR